jgi:hypothetical protein
MKGEEKDWKKTRKKRVHENRWYKKLKHEVSVTSKDDPVLYHTPDYEDVSGSGGAHPGIFNLDNTWEWSPSHSSRFIVAERVLGNS